MNWLFYCLYLCYYTANGPCTQPRIVHVFELDLYSRFVIIAFSDILRINLEQLDILRRDNFESLVLVLLLTKVASCCVMLVEEIRTKGMPWSSNCYDVLGDPNL